MKPSHPDNQKPKRRRDPDMIGAEAAMKRAAATARRRAAAHGGKVAMFEDGKIVWVKVEKDAAS